VLLIGGPPGAGKTTVARALARRHGLRLYSADTRTWEHRDRALAAGSEAAARWEARTPEERRRQPLEELLATSLYRERGAMVLADLAALPDHPLVVAEGSVIPPAPGALWLIPRQAARFDGHPDAALYRALHDVAEADAREHGLAVVRDVPDRVAAAEAHFADALRAGPHAKTRAERQALLREANLAVVAQIRGYHARPWAHGDPQAVRASFMCECGDPACEREVETTVGAAAAAPVLA
jgi:hypothetical protein